MTSTPKFILYFCFLFWPFNSACNTLSFCTYRRGMVKGGITKTRMFLLREAKRVERQVGKLQAGVVELDPPEQANVSDKAGCGEKIEGSTSYWTPHPRTGIYVPKGYEYVVDDVPKNAASFDRTYWLRNIDGVEKADPDLPPDRYF